MGYERIPTPANIWEFEPRGRMTKDDLVRLTYDNDAVLYVVKVDGRWILEPTLMPNELRVLLDRHYATNFRVIKYNVHTPKSGYVGSPLVLSAYGDDMYAGDILSCTSVPVITDISPASRPCDQSEISPDFAR